MPEGYEKQIHLLLEQSLGIRTGSPRARAVVEDAQMDSPSSFDLSAPAP